MSNTSENFFNSSIESICKLVRRKGCPRLGIFVPDGSRRMVRAFTDARPGSEEYYILCATLPAKHLLESLQVFFSHGLPTLLVPILSSSVIRRGSDYRRLTAMTGLQLLFDSQPWQDFYREFDVRVRVYGRPELLDGTECKEALRWIEETRRQTSTNCSHTLFFAIGEAPTIGNGVAERGIALFQRHGRTPTLEEQIVDYYGEDLPSADFFIMTSKMSGMGALPRFLVNGDTNLYFLPAAGPMGLNTATYRSVLHDLLFERTTLEVDYTDPELFSGRLDSLGEYYRASAESVVGLGKQIDNVWTLK